MSSWLPPGDGPGLGVYVHEARRENVIWYDDVVLGTGYVGPVERATR